MPTITANGIECYYEIYGKGQPLVLIAGYTGDHTFWTLMVEKLAQQFQVVIFDNRAIGQTKDYNKEFTLETMADDTVALMDQLGIKKVSIIGHSMGGMIAQIIAKKYSLRVNKLVILNSAVGLSVRTMSVLLSILNARKANIAFDLFIELATPWFFGNNYLANPENIIVFKEGLINNPYPQSVFDQERQFQALLSFNAKSWPEKINVPTLVIASTEDLIVSLAESQSLCLSIENAQFISVDGGHSSPVEAYQQLNHHLLQFL